MFEREDRGEVGPKPVHLRNQERRWWRPRGPGLRGFFHSVHMLVGLTVCLPLSLMGITGSMLVFQSSLDAQLIPSTYRAETNGSDYSFEDMLAAAKRAVPSQYIPVLFILDDLVTVRFTADASHAGPGRLEVFIDPSTLRILKIRCPDSTFFGRIKRLHTSLYISGEYGRQAAGWLGVAMMMLGITGLVAWWPKAGRWRDSFLINTDARGISLFKSIHRTAGIWGFAMFVVVTFGGVYLAFPKAVTRGIATVLPARDLRGLATRLRVKPIRGTIPITLDEAVSLASAKPGIGHLRLIGLPTKPDQPIRVVFSSLDHSDGAQVITVFLDPWTAKVLMIQDPKDYTLAEHLLALQHSLHSGRGFGWLYMTLVFLCGLLPTLFTFTGINIWWRTR